MKYALLLTLFLVACDGGKTDSSGYHKEPSDWQLAAKTHRCTEEQMNKAQREAKWCNDNTSYFTSYCYGSAILRNCTPAP